MVDTQDSGADRAPAGPAAPPAETMLQSLKGFASRLAKGSRSSAPLLVVDDEDAVRRFVDRVLRDAGYETATAASGAEAVEMAKQLGSIRALVTDVMMPGMTGDELARTLRQSEPSLKVLYLTAYSDRLFREKKTLWADEAFLDKPCTVKGLREAVALLLSGGVESPAGASS